MSTGATNPNVTLTNTSKVVSIFAGDYAAADEGSFFTMYDGIRASTAVACTTQALANTNPSLAIVNGQPIGLNSPNIYLRAIKLVVTTVAGSNTSVNYSSVLDNLNPKLTTLGTGVLTSVNVSTSSAGGGTVSKATAYTGVNIAGTATAFARQVAGGQVEGNLNVAFDEYMFLFGVPASGGDINGTVTNAKRVSIYHPPVIIAPGWTYTLGFWGASQAASAASYTMEISYLERPAGQ